MSPHLRYGWYLARHKWFVFRSGLRTGAPLWRLIVHDYTKMMPVEWFPYVENFYGKGKPGREARGSYSAASEENDSFRRAWLHHQHRNPHHWQHWILAQDDGTVQCLPMPDHFVREMVADWMGAGRTITGKWETPEWYAANRRKMQLHEITRMDVEFHLCRLFPRAIGLLNAEAANHRCTCGWATSGANLLDGGHQPGCAALTGGEA